MPVLEVEQVGAVRRLRLNRPERSNTLSGELLDALVQELRAAADDPGTSVVVLRGAGRGFCGGFDLTGGGAVMDFWADRERLRRTNLKLEEIWYCPLPVIAEVHGYCLAGGADLALHCDLIVCSTDARIGYPPVRNLGVPPSNLWVYRLGPQLAKRLLLTGDSITGEEAVGMGVAIEACPPEQLPERVLTLARRMTAVGREMLIGNKQVINRGVDLMGRALLSRFAESEDAVGHTGATARTFRDAVRERGLKDAVRDRDAPFQPDPPGFWRDRAPGSSGH